MYSMLYIKVVLFNHGSEDFEIKRGDRIAQLILERISMAGMLEVDELTETSRGAGGFGSTGVSGELPGVNTPDAVAGAQKRRRHDTGEFCWLGAGCPLIIFLWSDAMQVKKLSEHAVLPSRGSGSELCQMRQFDFAQSLMFNIM